MISDIIIVAILVSNIIIGCALMIRGAINNNGKIIQDKMIKHNEETQRLLNEFILDIKNKL